MVSIVNKCEENTSSIISIEQCQFPLFVSVFVVAGPSFTGVDYRARKSAKYIMKRKFRAGKILDSYHSSQYMNPLHYKLLKSAIPCCCFPVSLCQCRARYPKAANRSIHKASDAKKICVQLPGQSSSSVLELTLPSWQYPDQFS